MHTLRQLSLIKAVLCARCTAESPEAASGVVEDVFLGWGQRDATAQRDQHFLCQL